MIHQQPLHISLIDPSQVPCPPSPEVETSFFGASIAAASIKTTATTAAAAAAATTTAKTNKTSRKTHKSRSTKTQKRSVRFNETVSVRTCLHINDYTDDEFDQCWYQADECDAIKVENMQTVALVASGVKIDSDDNDLCLRGLEGRTVKGNRRRRENRQRAWDAVLDEQDRQADTVDEELMGNVMESVVLHCRNEAYAAALQDEIEALTIYTNDDTEGSEESAARREKVKVFIKKTRKLRRDVLEQGKQMRKAAQRQQQE